MGILDGAVKGALSGLADFGTAYMKEGFQERADARTLERARILQEDQYRLMEEREKSIAEFKMDLADKIRARTLDNVRAGVAQSSGIDAQFDAARDAYRNSSGYVEDKQGNRTPIDMEQTMSNVDAAEQGAIARAMRDPKAVQAGAMAAGEYDIAKGVESMTKDDNKLHNVPFGATVLDKDGKVVYDGSAELKKQLEADKIAARSSADPGKAQDSLTKIDKEARSTAKSLTEDERPPYSEDEKAVDTKLRDVLGDAMSQAMTTARKRGVVVNEREIGKALKERLKSLDDVHREVIDTRAASLFNDDGQLKNAGNADRLKQAGLKTDSVDDFKRSYRDQLLTLDNLRKYREDPTAYTESMKKLVASSQPKKAVSTGDDEDQHQGIISRVWNGTPEGWDPGQRHSKQSSSGKIKY